MEQGTETATGQWTAPECPFRIEYSRRVLDDIRLAVVEAFFSVPRGGAEIGGILLGNRDGDRIVIADCQPLDCEHAMGPSFTLSPRDQARLTEMLAAAGGNDAHRRPVGWYHSHTRSEIFLSETDQDIHRRFFPEPWQIALVLKPHTFEPMRAGFFFREADGSIRGAASYQEFVLDPLPARPMPALGGNGAAGAHAAPIAPPAESAAASGAAPTAAPAEKAPTRVPITREIDLEPPLTEARDGQAPAIETEELSAPGFTQLHHERSWRAIQAAIWLAAGLAVGIIGYQTRQYWLPQLLVKASAVLPKDPDAYLSLTVSDDNGQLRIQWDHNAPAVRNALDGTLEISDGNTAPQFVRLDNDHLATGAFSYARQNERVDVTLMASEPNGRIVKEQSSFLGRLPVQKGGAEEPPAGNGPDQAAQKADTDRKDHKDQEDIQAARARQLEKNLKAIRDQLQKEQKQGPGNQAPDPEKKE